MAVNMLSTDSTSQWVTNTASDTYIVQQGVYLAVQGTAISGTAAAANRKFKIDGHVIGEGGGSGMFIGQDAANGGFSTMQIGADGSVLGEAYGIVSHGGDLHFTNKGEVTGGSAGLYLTGGSNAVFNEGTILSYNGTGLNSQGASAIIENDGAIIGETCGVLLAGPASVLTNDGTIFSSGNTMNTTAVQMAGGNSTLFNNGTVDTNGGRVILGSDDSEDVVNTGYIHGYVELGDGSDIFINDGGSVFGIVHLGDGDDVFSSKNGYFSGSVTGGEGNDEYHIYDNHTVVSEDGSAGYDRVYAYVSYTLRNGFELLVLEGDEDIDGVGNVFDNSLTGNSGDNRLYGKHGDDVFQAGLGNDLYDGGLGIDTLNFNYWYTLEGGVTVNLQTGRGGGAAAGHRYRNIENVYGTDLNDRITGNSAANTITGARGDDVLAGMGGKDVFQFTGLAGKDTITDFQDKADRILINYQVNQSNPSSYAAIKDFISQKGNDVVIDFSSIADGDRMILKNTDRADISAADFLF